MEARLSTVGSSCQAGPTPTDLHLVCTQSVGGCILATNLCLLFCETRLLSFREREADVPVCQVWGTESHMLSTCQQKH